MDEDHLNSFWQVYCTAAMLAKAAFASRKPAQCFGARLATSPRCCCSLISIIESGAARVMLAFADKTQIPLMTLFTKTRTAMHTATGLSVDSEVFVG